MKKHHPTPRYAIGHRESSQDGEMVFLSLYSEFQETESSCGPTVLVDILKTFGINIAQSEIIDYVNEVLAKSSETEDSLLERTLETENPLGLIDKYGTPPEVMIEILSKYNIVFEIKDSVPAEKREINKQAALETNKAPNNSTNSLSTELATASDFFEKYYYKVRSDITKKSREYLLDKLRAGYVVITPVQDIPSLGEKRDLDVDGHYVIVCGFAVIEGKRMLIIVDPLNHSSEGNVSLLNNYGLRFVDIKTFMPIWQDVDWKGTPYVQYGIAIKISRD